MPVSNFECQIARGQIGRYLSGGVLSPQAMRGLEEHLDECPSCKALVAERRAALIDQLDGSAPTHAVVSMPSQAPKAAPRENPLVAALRARSTSEEDEAPKSRVSAPRYAKPVATAGVPAALEEPSVAKETKRSGPTMKPLMGKPLALTAVLAVVLIAMSYLTKGNGGQGALGGKAADTFAPQRFASGSFSARTQPIASTSETTSDARAATEPAPNLPFSPRPDATSAEPTGIVAPSTPMPLPPGSKPKTPAPVPTSETTTPEPAPRPQASQPQTARPAVRPKPVVQKPVAPKPVSVAKPRPVAVRRSAPRPVVRRSVPVRKAVSPPAPAKKAPAVRVYGPDGKPINP